MGEIEYHSFIAHSSDDEVISKEIYSELLELGYGVFIDYYDIMPGDEWDRKIENTQENSLSTIIIISDNTGESYYQREEIVRAIDLHNSEDSVHKVIPIISGGSDFSDLPYGLNRIQAIHIDEYDDINGVAKKISKVLDGMKKSKKVERVEKKPHPGQEGLFNNKSKEVDVQKSNLVSELIKDAKKILKREVNTEEPATIFFVDIDKFTQINQNFGEEVGDKVVKNVIKIIKKVIGDYYIKHMGADEFFVCQSGLGRLKSLEIGEKLVEEVENFPWWYVAHDMKVTVSLGIARYDINENSDGVEKAREWIVRSILGAKHSKDSGGNTASRGPETLPDNRGIWVRSEGGEKEISKKDALDNRISSGVSNLSSGT